MTPLNYWFGRKFQSALRYLDEQELEKAEKIGHQMVARHYTGGFEVLGRVAMEEDDYAEAISWLQRGLDEAPETPSFWSYLGQCFSDGAIRSRRTCLLALLRLAAN